MAAKPKITPAVEERMLGALATGATMEMAAKAGGVTRKGLYKYIDRHPEFGDRVNEARSAVDDIVESRLFDQTKSNVTACIFWLKNRRPSEWRDRHDYEVSSKERVVHQVQLSSGAVVPPAVAGLPRTGSPEHSEG